MNIHRCNLTHDIYALTTANNNNNNNFISKCNISLHAFLLQVEIVTPVQYSYVLLLTACEIYWAKFESVANAVSIMAFSWRMQGSQCLHPIARTSPVIPIPGRAVYGS